MPNPLVVLREATKAVPAFRYAWVVVGLATLAAIVFEISKGVASTSSTVIVAIVIMLILTVLAYLFAALVKMGSPVARIPALMLVYTCIGLFIVWSGLVTSCTFFGRPIPIWRLMSQFGFSAPQTTPEATALTQATQPFRNASVNVRDLPGVALKRVQAEPSSRDFAAELARERPNLVLDRSILVIGAVNGSAPVKLYLSALIMRDGGEILTNGNDVYIYARTISGGEIVSFDPAAPNLPQAPTNDGGLDGRSGGRVFLWGTLHSRVPSSRSLSRL